MAYVFIEGTYGRNRQPERFPRPALSAKWKLFRNCRRELGSCHVARATRRWKENYEPPRARRRGSYSKSPVLDAATYARSQRAGRGLAWYGARTRHFFSVRPQSADVARWVVVADPELPGSASEGRAGGTVLYAAAQAKGIAPNHLSVVTAGGRAAVG